MPSVPMGAERLTDFDAAREIHDPGPRHRAIRVAAESLHERFEDGPRVLAVRTLPLTTLPYPTKYAFQGSAGSLTPFVRFTHRATLVQFLQRGAVKTLLFNPTDLEGARATPYFAQLAARFGALEPLLQKRFPTLEAQLHALGVAPADIDYVAFDHFHTQDLRGLLGSPDGRLPARFPNATLLAPKLEWDAWDDLHPMQRAWFVADGRRDVDTTRVAFTDADLVLGDGVLLVRTPGHTTGNQTLFLATERGVWGISENGTCADNWSPRESRIRGVAQMARAQELDVVLNANTPELGAEQYTSMILERSLVSRVREAPEFVQMLPSSEVTPSLLMPIRPTWVHGGLDVGDVVRPQVRARVSAEGARASTP